MDDVAAICVLKILWSMSAVAFQERYPPPPSPPPHSPPPPSAKKTM